jgi:hypothetical protein
MTSFKAFYYSGCLHYSTFGRWLINLGGDCPVFRVRFISYKILLNGREGRELGLNKMAYCRLVRMGKQSALGVIVTVRTKDSFVFEDM